MHFKAGSDKPKATLEIAGKTYKIKAPSVGQANKLAADLEEATGKTKVQSALMKKFLCDLGQIPELEIDKIEQEMFNELLDYVISSKKN
jgi:hypothetical protein